MTTWRDDAHAHLCATYPREGCGLLVRDDTGAEVFVATPNLSHSATEQFTIAPEDYADAEDRGEVIAVIHSHVDAPTFPSVVDLAQCEGTGIPWYIFRVDGKEVAGEPVTSPIVTDERCIEPSGYVAPLIGRPFTYGVHDCYALARDWYSRTLGVELPDFDHGPDCWWDPTHENYLPDFDPYTEHMEAAGFEPAAGPLQVGDCIIMQIRSLKPNHIGVYIGDGMLLHHLRGRLSERVIYGGYWADVTVRTIRRKQ